MNLNLNSNTAEHTKVSNQESSEHHITKKNNHKKVNSKMFEKIFEAMNSEQKSNINKKPKHNLSTNIDKPKLHSDVITSKKEDDKQAPSIFNSKEEKITDSTSIPTEEKVLGSKSKLDIKVIDNGEKPFETKGLDFLNQATLQEGKSAEAATITPFFKEVESLVVDTNIATKSSLEKIKGNDDSLDNLINDIKLAKVEYSQMLVSSSSTVADSNWTVTDFKTDKMKLSDWVDAFKSDVQKLNAFKVENHNKVSLTLKNDTDLIRVVVEKKENSIVITAKSTEESKENLSFILAEIQSEMAEKNVEVIVNIEDDPRDDNANQDEQEQDREESSKQQGEKNNDSNKHRKQR